MLELEVWRVFPIVAAFPPQVAFVMFYAIPKLGAGRWWTDFTGRAIFFKSWALMMLLLFSAMTVSILLLSGVARLVWDFSLDRTYGAVGLDEPWYTILTVLDLAAAFFYWVLLVTVVYQLAALLHERKHK